MVRGFNNGLPGSSLKVKSSSGLTLYIILLIVSKFLKVVGLYVAYDLLKLIPIIIFLFLLKIGSAVPFLFLQKPFSLGQPLSKSQWYRIWRHAFFGTVISFLWVFGLTQCGPLRTVLLFEHSDAVIIAGASALFSSNGAGGPSKARGAFIFMIGVVSLLLFDHDEKLSHQMNDGERVHHTIFSHLFKHGMDFLGWSDHKGGVLLLFLTMCLNCGYNTAAKKLSVEIGGAKRLHSLSTVVSAGILWPWACFVFFTEDIEIQSWLYMVFPLILVVLFIGVFDFYIEGVAATHLQPMKASTISSIALFFGAVFLSVTWTHPYITHVTTMHKLNDVLTEDHVLSGGVVFSTLAFLLATRILVSKGKMTKGSFIGYSPAGVPLYSISSEALQKTTNSLVSVLKGGLRHILDDADSRKIFYFLCINLGFTFVELLYGVWTNSLGLISDGFHMFFDCSALVMGLYAAVMSKWKATRIFSYGYDRVEVLSGFINGLFLVVIAIFVFTEGIMRLLEPPEVKTERLLTVSILGLLVNLIGILAFTSSLHHGHSHVGLGGHGHSHGGQSHSHGDHGNSHGSHGHSHGSHGHSHGGHGHSHGGNAPSECSGSSTAGSSAAANTNMQGVFLHVLADTMGSVGVIISTLLIENFGWNIADPICSLFIATMIFLSVLPLLKETAIILLVRSPKELDASINSALFKIRSIEGVLSMRDPHFWCHTASKALGTLHIQVWPQAQEQRIITQASSILKEAGLHNMTIQVEKQSYFFHMSGLGATPVNINNFSEIPLPTPGDEMTIKAI